MNLSACARHTGRPFCLNSVCVFDKCNFTEPTDNQGNDTTADITETTRNLPNNDVVNTTSHGTLETSTTGKLLQTQKFQLHV